MDKEKLSVIRSEAGSLFEKAKGLVSLKEAKELVANSQKHLKELGEAEAKEVDKTAKSVIRSTKNLLSAACNFADRVIRSHQSREELRDKQEKELAEKRKEKQALIAKHKKELEDRRAQRERTAAEQAAPTVIGGKK